LLWHDALSSFQVGLTIGQQGCTIIHKAFATAGLSKEVLLIRPGKGLIFRAAVLTLSLCERAGVRGSGSNTIRSGSISTVYPSKTRANIFPIGKTSIPRGGKRRFDAQAATGLHQIGACAPKSTAAG
jgi:hypothetical protein